MRRMLAFLAAGLLLASCQTAEPPADSTAPFPDGRIVDLSHAYDEDTIYWPTEDGFALETRFEGMTDGGYFYEANVFTSAEHGGTHIDAPVHFSEGKQSVDEIPLDRLMGPAVVVDVSARCAEDPDYQISTSDFEAWEAEHGRLPDGAIVLLYTGYGASWPDRTAYMGTDERGEEGVANLHFPGLHPHAAAWLVQQRSIHAIGLDTPSIDYGQSKAFESHRRLFAENIPAFENVANLDQLPPTGSTVIALPMKIRSGSGGPLRVVAIVP